MVSLPGDVVHFPNTFLKQYFVYILPRSGSGSKTGKGNAIHDVSGINSSTSEVWLDRHSNTNSDYIK